MQLSVILPCYNGASTIALQLEALVSQVWSGSWELLVINNGSTDGSMEIVEQYRDRLPNLRIIEAYTDRSQPRKGVVHSYNLGIQAAQGEAVAFCEADDEMAPGWLAAMGEGLAKHDLVGGRLDYQKLNPDWLYVARDDYQQVDGLVQPDWFPYPFSSGCNLGMRRSLYDSVGELDESLPCCYDTDYCFQAQIKGFKMAFLPDALMYYRLRTTWQSLFRQGKTWGKDTLLIKEKYRESLEEHPVQRRIIRLLKFLVQGVRLFIMSALNIRRGKGGFALWTWGLGYQLGELQTLLSR